MYRRFLTLLLMAFVLCGAGQAFAIDHGKGYGEPYEMAGKRMVFNTWYWVRPGQMDWRDDEGKSVFANDQVMAGPFDSHYINIDGPWGVRLTVEKAQRGKLDVDGEKPWEAGGVNIAYMLPTPDGKIMCWGDSIDANGKKHACYLESTDGLTFTRPSLGLIDFEGSKDNNLIPGGPRGHIFLDTNPDAPPEERFKQAVNSDWKLDKLDEYKTRRPWQVMATETDVGRVHAIFGYVSPDGFRWKRIEEPLSVEISDGDQSVYWDPYLKKYVMYARTYFVGRRADGFPLKHERRHQFIGRRAMGRSESDNFHEFPLSEVIIETTNSMPPTDTFYLNCYTRIPGAPDEHVMFPSRYIQHEDKTALDLYTSYDGKSWHIAPGSPVLETADFGQFDGGCLIAYPHLIERSNGDWILLYRGDIFPHKYPRGKQASEWGIAVWPKGRLSAIEAPEQGAFTTPAFLLPGQKLRINAKTSRVGEIRVEVADFYGETLPGYTFEDSAPIIGDQYQTPVTWKNAESLNVPVGEPVVLRFRMKLAKMYGLDFE